MPPKTDSDPEEKEKVSSSSSSSSSSSWRDGAPKFYKLFFVLACYSFLFYTTVKHALWFLKTWHKEPAQVFLIDWINCVPECGPSVENILRHLCVDIGLFVLFMLQHSLLSERQLAGTYIHQKVFIDWEINGSLYTLTTGIALHVLMTYWEVIPVYLWKLTDLQPVFKVVHFLAWLSLYGTTLMQDMPELIGLNQQVVFINEITSRKSEEFKTMLKKQRHLGFVPFTILTLCCGVMTLDRFLYLVVMMSYTYFTWRNSESFHYIRDMANRKQMRLCHGIKSN